jgi:hypothetical protein
LAPLEAPTPTVPSGRIDPADEAALRIRSDAGPAAR